MAVVTLTPACNTRLAQTLSLESTNNNNPPYAICSAYFNNTEKSFNLSPIVSKRHGHDDHGGIKNKEEGELGIFGAEKYFNGVMDDHEDNTPMVTKISTAVKPQSKKESHEEKVDLLAPTIVESSKVQQPGTPSVRSGSSSSSQNVLLESIKNSPRTKTKKANGKSLLATFGCKCSCYDKNSVDIREHVGEISFNTIISPPSGQGHAKRGTKAPIKTAPDILVHHAVKKTHSDSWVRDKNIDKMEGMLKAEESITFRTLNPHEPAKDFPVKLHMEKGNEEANQRKSIEVFRSPLYGRSKTIAFDQKRLSRLSWDAMAKAKPELETSEELCSECESDASSDLFELESITGRNNSACRRQSSDTISDCVTSTTCYAPSEASIEWSVVTASAADFSTISTSEYDDQGYMSVTSPDSKTFSTTQNARTVERKDMLRRGPGMLLGCKNHRAVRVAGDHVYCRANQKMTLDSKMQRRSDSCKPVSRIQAKNSKKQADSRHEEYDSVSPSILHSSRMPYASNLLYIQ